jgi:hypothetical protein
MLATQKTALFEEITPEQSAIVSGGGMDPTVVNFDLNSYLFILGAGVVFGNPGLTWQETNFAFEQSIYTLGL